MATLFCFRCGDALLDLNGTLTCVRGDMPLSVRLAAKLKERYVGRATTGSEPAFRVGDVWYCPGCGSGPGGPSCLACGTSTGDLLHDMVDLHPHA